MMQVDVYATRAHPPVMNAPGMCEGFYVHHLHCHRRHCCLLSTVNRLLRFHPRVASSPPSLLLKNTLVDQSPLSTPQPPPPTPAATPGTGFAKALFPVDACGPPGPRECHNLGVSALSSTFTIIFASAVGIVTGSQTAFLALETRTLSSMPEIHLWMSMLSSKAFALCLPCTPHRETCNWNVYRVCLRQPLPSLSKTLPSLYTAKKVILEFHSYIRIFGLVLKIALYTEISNTNLYSKQWSE